MNAVSLITNTNLIDGLGGAPKAGTSVLMDAGRIAWIGPDENAPSIGDKHVIDGNGRSLIPGLINSHVHLVNDGSADLFEQVVNDSLPIASLRAAQNARYTLACGVTTVRDCGAANGIVIELGKAVEAGLVEGPRIVAAGRVITMTGGHGHFMGREADGTDAIRHAVRAEIKGGSQFIKAMATGGVLTPGVRPTQTALLAEELRTVVQEAHNAGKRVATHAIGRQGIKNALDAGVDSIEHGYHLDEELFTQAIDQGTFLVPTLLAVDGIVEFGPAGGSPGWMIDKAILERDRSREMFRAAVQAGMRVAAGTDAGTPFNRHTDLPKELAVIVAIGMTPMQALLAATANAAANLDLLDEIGTIEVGKAADLVLLDGDPLKDIGAYGRPVLVAKAGVIARNDLVGLR
ncbi:amidohydrolase family protein [Streptomyces europaeiscabiei]|uniref:metal-dependent hydrolase family protein n=1 Tax=Streptomyces europaeiscabiei TaxID=146819 RepID=UPI002E109CEE|nr:amidohydrolase family protein [Streptomyces europaeiscabiei]